MPAYDEAFEVHVMGLLDSAYGLALWYVADRQDAEDAVHEAVLNAYKSFPMFRGADPKPWFMQIVRNCSLQTLGRRKRSVDLTESEQEYTRALPVLGDPEAALLAQLEAAVVREEVARLPLVFREVLVLREFDDMSYREISEVIGAPVGTVMSRLSRARDELSAALRERMEERP